MSGIAGRALCIVPGEGRYSIGTFFGAYIDLLGFLALLGFPLSASLNSKVTMQDLIGARVLGMKTSFRVGSIGAAESEENSGEESWSHFLEIDHLKLRDCPR